MMVNVMRMSMRISQSLIRMRLCASTTSWKPAVKPRRLRTSKTQNLIGSKLAIRTSTKKTFSTKKTTYCTEVL